MFSGLDLVVDSSSDEDDELAFLGLMLLTIQSRQASMARREGNRSVKRRKSIVYEDEDEEEDEEEVNQVSLPLNNNDEEEIDESEDDDGEVRPIGNVVRVSGEGESRRQHFKGFEFDGVKYELEDSVLVSPEEDNMKPSVTIIKDIIETGDGRITVTGRRFYRPEIAENENGGNWESGEGRELFYSFDEIEFAGEAIMHKCRVHFVPPNKAIPNAREFPGFFVEKVYDSKLKRLYAILDNDEGCEDDSWQREVFVLVQKTKDRIPNWPLKMQVISYLGK